MEFKCAILIRWEINDFKELDFYMNVGVFWKWMFYIIIFFIFWIRCICVYVEYNLLKGRKEIFCFVSKFIELWVRKWFYVLLCNEFILF